jgi:hypothetical protein
MACSNLHFWDILNLSSPFDAFLLVHQVQITTALAAPAAPVGSMATQTSRDDTVSKGIEEQTTQGTTAAVTTPSQATPMETQELDDVDGKNMQSVHLFGLCNFYIVVTVILAYVCH